MRRMFAIVLALAMVLTMAACTPNAPANNFTKYAEIPGLEDGILTVGMECNYAPYNWTQPDDSNGAVAIVNNPGSYANGYDVIIAKKIAEAYNVDLQIMALEWGGLCPALGNAIDAVIAGQSMTPERLAEVDMAGPYYYASIVCVAREGTPQASATGISNLTGTCTAQSSTIWYESCLPQIPGAEILTEAADAPTMIMSVVSGTADFICTDMPTAMGAVAAHEGLVILDFTGTDDDFEVDQSEIDIGVSVKKGNTGLKTMIDDVLSKMTVEDFNKLMNDAIAIQPTL